MDKRPPSISRKVSPCKDCKERFIACHDRCPKDERGEYGYLAWKAEMIELEKKRTRNRADTRRTEWKLRNG